MKKYSFIQVMPRFENSIIVYILLVLLVAGVFSNDEDFETPAKIREKRQGRNRNRPRPPDEDDRRYLAEEEYVEPKQMPRNRGGAQPLLLNLGVLDGVLHNLAGSPGSALSLGGQPEPRPVHQGGPQPHGPEFNGGRPPPPPRDDDRIPPGHQERPGHQPGNRPPGKPGHKPGPPPPERPDQRPAPPPGRPGEHPRPPKPRPEDSQGFEDIQPTYDNDGFGNSRPGGSQSYQNSRPQDDSDGFTNSRPGERPEQQNSRPGGSQSYQNPQSGYDNDEFENSRPSERPGQQNSRPGGSQSYQNPRPGDDNDEFVNLRPVERPVQQNSRPGGSQSYQTPRPGVDNDGFINSRPGDRPGQQNSRPGGSQSYQTSRPGNDNNGFGNSRPVERPVQQSSRPVDSQSFQSNGKPGGEINNGFGNSRPGEGNNGQQNSRPNNGQQGLQNFGGSGQQSSYPNGIGDDNDRYNGVSTDSRPQPNRGEGNKKCRGNQYTCQNRECVPRNARCNGVNECRDGSDEINCYTAGNSPGQGSSNDYTTAAPHGQTTASPTEGCIIPEQPTGGKFELNTCKKPCTVVSGTRVPIGSFLTYKCNEGYSIKGNNVSFCHVDSWYLPPTCIKTCPPLRSNSVDIVCKYQGEIVSCESSISAGTTATLACKHSYKIPLADDPAYRELTCQEDGIWDRTLFRCLPECGTAVAHGNTLIVNGFTAKLGVFPWHVGIYQRNTAESFIQICAGSLISPDLVISAAHCFYDDTINEVMDASQYAVAAGKHYRDYDTHEKYVQKSLIKSIEVASRYYGASGNFAEDIALVRVKKSFTLTTLVRPICMDWDNRHEREQLQSGKVGKAVGWGKTAEGLPSEELQEINLPFIPYHECVSAVPEEFRGYVTPDKFCAGYLNGSSLCEGDSGGGLGFQLESLWYLRGIVSVSPVSKNSCDNNYYTAFTNVGRFRDWIRAAYVSS